MISLHKDKCDDKPSKKEKPEKSADEPDEKLSKKEKKGKDDVKPANVSVLNSL